MSNLLGRIEDLKRLDSLPLRSVVVLDPLNHFQDVANYCAFQLTVALVIYAFLFWFVEICFESNLFLVPQKYLLDYLVRRIEDRCICQVIYEVEAFLLWYVHLLNDISTEIHHQLIHVFLCMHQKRIISLEFVDELHGLTDEDPKKLDVRECEGLI